MNVKIELRIFNENYSLLKQRKKNKFQLPDHSLERGHQVRNKLLIYIIYRLCT